MRRLLSVILFASALLAQTTNYPGALDTNSSLFVSADNVQTYLTQAMLAGDAVAIVKSTTGFAANQIATVCESTVVVTGTVSKCSTWEHMLVTSVVNANTLAVTRGIAGTSAIAHASGKLVSVLIDSAHQASLKAAVIALETAVGTGATGPQGTGAKVQRAAGTTTTAHCPQYDASGSLVDSGAPCNALPAAAAQLQYLRTKPNSGNLTTYEFAGLMTLNQADYNFTAQSPGGSLAIGNTQITMTPVPLGVNGTDSHHYLYVSGGVGTAEACLITGGTGTAGSASGAIIINCANTHTGAFTVQSATAGIEEMLITANGQAAARLSGGTSNIYAPIYWSTSGGKPLYLIGAGVDSSAVLGSTIQNLGTGDIFQLVSADLSEFYLGHFYARNNGSGTGNGITCTGCTGLETDHINVEFNGGYGIICTQCFSAVLFNSTFNNNGLHGARFYQSNNVKIYGSVFDGNGKAGAGYAGLNLDSGSGFSIVASDFEGNGTAAFAGGAQTSGYGILATVTNGVHLNGNYFENGLTNHIYLGATVTGFSVAANYFLDAGLTIDTANNGVVLGNVMQNFANPSLTVSTVTDSAGRCRIVTTGAHNLVANTFVKVASIGGATACNGGAVVTSIVNSTTFEINIGPGAGYTTGGTVRKTAGLYVSNASAGATSNLTILGNDLTQTDVVVIRSPLLEGVGSALASATTITPIYKTHHVTGTTAVVNITVPPEINPRFCAIPDGAFTTTNAGNIAIASTAVVGKQLCFNYDSGTSKWYPSY